MRSPRSYWRRLRERRRRGSVWPALVASFLVHSLGVVGLAQFPKSQPEQKVLKVAFVSRGVEKGDKEAATEPAQPAQPKPQPQPQPQTPQPPTPRPPAPPSAPQPTLAPAPDALFPALLPQPGKGPPKPVDLSAPQSFAAFQKKRMAPFLPTHIADGGGDPDGDASVDSDGRDKCEPFPNRRLDRVYLLFDTSGSMSDQLKAQALSCAQQYAQTAIDAGASVVVANFAATSTFHPPTRNMTDVALALRGGSDPTATVLPSNELNPFLDQDPGAHADLVILSDGYLPNYRDVLPWYRYFLDLNPENRGYMYTLGTPGHPEVVGALRQAGFDVYVYKIL